MGGQHRSTATHWVGQTRGLCQADLSQPRGARPNQRTVRKQEGLSGAATTLDGHENVVVAANHVAPA